MSTIDLDLVALPVAHYLDNHGDRNPCLLYEAPFPGKGLLNCVRMDRVSSTLAGMRVSVVICTQTFMIRSN